MFKNLSMYNLDPEWMKSPGEIEDLLAKHPLRELQGLNTGTTGWIGCNQSGQLVVNTARHVLMNLGKEEKLLPGRVVKREVEKRAEELEQKQGFKPGKKQIRDLKEQLITELLPRAFTQGSATRGWLDFENHRLIVESASSSADDFVSALRESLGELPASFVDTEISASVLLTKWVLAQEAPGQFTIDNEVELVGVDSQKPTVKYVRHELGGKEVLGHIEGGKLVTKLALTWADRVSFVINDKLQIRKLAYTDMKADEENSGAGGTPDDRLAADFELMTGEVGKMLSELLVALSPAANGA